MSAPLDEVIVFIVGLAVVGGESIHHTLNLAVSVVSQQGRPTVTIRSSAKKPQESQ
jgi:hypothetical protein